MQKLENKTSIKGFKCNLENILVSSCKDHVLGVLSEERI